MAWIMANWGLIATVLLGVSEALSQIPGIESNSIFELILNGLRAMVAPAPKS